jgi:Tfp pilus assembly protein FimT
MDDFRDTQKQDNIPKFLDRQDLHTNPFGLNRSGERLYRRAERIIAALHLLTNHIEDQEPLRKEIRSISIRLLPQILELRSEMRAVGSAKVHDVEASVRHLISLVRMLAIASFISVQNAEAVTEALDEIGNFLTVSQRSALSDGTRFTKEDLLDVRESRKTLQKDIRDSLSDKDKDINNADGQSDNVRENAEGRTINVQESNSVRSVRIVEVLRTQGEIGIRDIATTLPEYSEKMIQRELVRLVSDGKVKKVGSKRWSKYAVIAQG